MMDFNERVIPGISSNFMLQEELSKYEFASTFLRPQMKVLDMGCGTGYGEKVFHKKECEVTGIDISKDAVRFAKKYFNQYATYQVQNVTDTNFKNHSFDFAVSFEVIEHLKSPKKFLKEVKRVLKPNSHFVLSTPNTVVSKYSSPYHEKEFEYTELYKLLKLEFRRVKVYGQVYSPVAKHALSDFLKSQNSREKFVKSDKLNIRKMLPKSFKEKVWKHLGSFYGRKTQDTLLSRDFPISLKNVKESNDFVAVCQN